MNADFPALRMAFDLNHQDDHKRFREALRERVLDWLNHDFDKLRRVLYRIDVSEAAARAAFDALEAPLVADRLTDLLIEREMQKIKTRNTSNTND
jgi:hypothetical protein